MAYTLTIFLKNLSSFCKSYSHFFSKNTCELDIDLTRLVNILTTNELVKLTMLWTTGPRFIITTDNGLILLELPNFSSLFTDCSMLSIPHGRISVNESAHGTKVNISCDQGYSLHGVPSLVCFEGTWRGATPSCYRGILVPGKTSKAQITTIKDDSLIHFFFWENKAWQFSWPFA